MNSMWDHSNLTDREEHVLKEIFDYLDFTRHSIRQLPEESPVVFRKLVGLSHEEWKQSLFPDTLSRLTERGYLRPAYILGSNLRWAPQRPALDWATTNGYDLPGASWGGLHYLYTIHLIRVASIDGLSHEIGINPELSTDPPPALRCVRYEASRRLPQAWIVVTNRTPPEDIITAYQQLMSDDATAHWIFQNCRICGSILAYLDEQPQIMFSSSHLPLNNPQNVPVIESEHATISYEEIVRDATPADSMGGIDAVWTIKTLHDRIY